MPNHETELRHIVDVDGRLVGIDAETVDAATLRRRAGVDSRLPLFLLGAGRAILIGEHDLVRLTEDEVSFFSTSFTPNLSIAA